MEYSLHLSEYAALEGNRSLSSLLFSQLEQSPAQSGACIFGMIYIAKGNTYIKNLR